MPRRLTTAMCGALMALLVASCAQDGPAAPAPSSERRGGSTGPVTPPIPNRTTGPSPTAALAPTGITVTTVVADCPAPRDPACPDKPVDATMSVVDSSGVVVASFDTGPKGQATVTMKPGAYRLQPVYVKGAYIIPAGPIPAAVEAGHVTAVTIYFGSRQG